MIVRRTDLPVRANEENRVRLKIVDLSADARLRDVELRREARRVLMANGG